MKNLLVVAPDNSVAAQIETAVATSVTAVPQVFVDVCVN